MGGRLTFEKAYKTTLGETISSKTQEMLKNKQPLILDDFVLFENRMIFRIYSYIKNFVDFFQENDLGIIEVSNKEENYNIYYVLMTEVQLRKLQLLVSYMEFKS